VGEDDNVSDSLPKTDIEAAALRPAIALFLRSIPTAWTEFDSDKLTKLQENALLLLTAAGMVERRGWIRTTIANHPTCFEIRFQATGEGGFAKAMERATAIEYATWADAWRKWTEGETRNRSPFHTQEMKPQEWRLTDQGEIARNDLNRGTSDVERVFDFVLKQGFFGPGFWMRKAIAGRPLTQNEQQTIAAESAAGQDLAQLARPAVGGDGQLLEIRRIENSAISQPVNVTNWEEGASAFADVLGKMLGTMFEEISKEPQIATENEAGNPHPQPTGVSPPGGAPTPFRGGEIVFQPDRVLLCGVDVCSGPRSAKRRKLLELLSRRRADGSFEAYDSDGIAKLISLSGGANAVPGLVRDLRKEIVSSLGAEANIGCGLEDVILSRGPGYRFASTVSVHDETQPAPAAPSATGVPDGPDQGHPNDPGHDDPNGPDVPDDDPDEPHKTSRRQAWILNQLAEGREMRTPDVVKRFGCSSKTAKRDLRRLKKAGKIVFVGYPRTGTYRLKQPGASQE
jgi:hypothetical protein